MNDIPHFAVLAMFLVVGLWAGNRARPWSRLFLVLFCMAVLTQIWGMWFERNIWHANFDALAKQTGMTPKIVDDLDPWSEITVPPQIGRYRWTSRTFVIPHIAAGVWTLIGYAVGRVGRLLWASRLRGSNPSVESTEN